MQIDEVLDAITKNAGINILVAVIIGFILDLIFGDPHWMPHPVRLIGWMISKGEKLLRRLMPVTQKGEFLGGMILTILVTGISRR